MCQLCESTSFALCAYPCIIFVLQSVIHKPAGLVVCIVNDHLINISAYITPFLHLI